MTIAGLHTRQPRLPICARYCTVTAELHALGRGTADHWQAGLGLVGAALHSQAH